MSIADKLLQIAQNSQQELAIRNDIHRAILSKGVNIPVHPYSAYADAISRIVQDMAIPKIVWNMPFEVEPEPTEGNVWYVRPMGSGLQNGTSWDNAFATRQEAVNAASAGDRVYVMEGVYYIEQVQTFKIGVSEYYGFPLSGLWEDRQPFKHPSKHDANYSDNNFQNNDRTFLSDQTVDGLWVSKVEGATGIYCNTFSNFKYTIVENCGGTADVLGGGVYLSYGGRIEKSAIINCIGKTGGGLWMSSSYSLDNIVINCTSVDVGGIYASSDSVSNNDIIINANATTHHAGMQVIGSTARGAMVLNNISRNMSGGINIGSRGGVINSIIVNCHGNTEGGGVNSNNASVFANNTIINCTSNRIGDGVYVVNTPYVYNNVCIGCRLYFANANYDYQIYNCASNLPLTGVNNWDVRADVRGFVDLFNEPFPFVAEGVDPFNQPGSFFTELIKSTESLNFIHDNIIPKMPDLRPHAASPLIGAGYYEAGITPDTDITGKIRPLPPSIGAYEP